MILVGIIVSVIAILPSSPNESKEGSNLEEKNAEIFHAKNPSQIPTPNFKVAFIADQGMGDWSVKVLELIKKEGTNMVLHQGDFDYNDDPEGWDNQINNVLGKDFPYFASIGNHDVNAWQKYQQKLLERLDRIPEINCHGDLGVKSSCKYHGLFFILSGVGLLGNEHDNFIQYELDYDDSIWRICSWHLNMKEMQVGSKKDKTGWEVYEECNKGGAIIATGHDHSYARTKTLISMENQIIDPEWPEPNHLRVKAGSTFVVISGLGGYTTIHSQERCLPISYPYGCKGEWVSIYTSENQSFPGALFCIFHVDGKPNNAKCYFKDINGNILDEFQITSFLGNKN